MVFIIELLWLVEDGTELSAAGQMKTVLGVKGLDQVCLPFVAGSVWCSDNNSGLFDLAARAGLET